MQARNFAVMTGVNAGISCVMKRIRGVEDVQTRLVDSFSFLFSFSCERLWLLYSLQYLAGRLLLLSKSLTKIFTLQKKNVQVTIQDVVEFYDPSLRFLWCSFKA